MEEARKGCVMTGIESGAIIAAGGLTANDPVDSETIGERGDNERDCDCD